MYSGSTPSSEAPVPLYDSHSGLRRGRVPFHSRNPYASVTSTLLNMPRVSQRQRQELSNSILEDAHGFPYLRKLQAHRSCVNALTFTSGDGRFLASGGDDLCIHLWDFHQEDVKEPSYTLRGPKGNVFCLEFSSTNRFLYSAGTDEKIYKFDVSHLATPIAYATHMPSDCISNHKDTIRAITCHPIQDELFMSASEDGSIIRQDGRQPSRIVNRQDVIRTDSEMTGVQYHPTIEHLFATSDGAGRVFLRDSRMAFGPLVKRSKNGIVQRFTTRLTKKSVGYCNPEASSITFDREGTKLAVTFLHSNPTIYSISDANPIAILSGKNLPDGTPVPPNQRTYSNTCTMKHGSFGGPGLDTDDMYAGGSDDFRCYIWKVPPIDRLVALREEYTVNVWDFREDSSTSAFTAGHQESKYVPIELSTPFCRLTGYNSIVNTTVFHPHFLHVVTAGVEKHVFLHSPTASSPCTQDLQKAPTVVRQPRDEVSEEAYLSAILRDNPFTTIVDEVDDTAERQTLDLFDFIIRDEGTRDVFDARRWSSDSSGDSSGSEQDTPESEGAIDSDYLMSYRI